MLEVVDEAVPAVGMGVVEVVEVEAVEAVEAVEVMTMTTTMMTTTMTPQLRPWRGHPDVEDGEEPTGSSMTPRCNNN